MLSDSRIRAYFHNLDSFSRSWPTVYVRNPEYRFSPPPPPPFVSQLLLLAETDVTIWTLNCNSFKP